MTLREKLLAHKPKLTPITLMGETYFLKSLSIGEANEQWKENRAWLLKQASIEGVILPNEEDEQFESKLGEFGAKYSLARAMAQRVVDKNGERLFDPNNIDDINLITGLDNQVLLDFTKALDLASPKNSASADDSN